MADLLLKAHDFFGCIMLIAMAEQQETVLN